MPHARVRDLDLCWDSFGDRRDPALILVMGLGCQMTHWDEGLCRKLAATGRWVVRFDNRDMGESSRLDQHPAPDIKRLVLSSALRRRKEIPYTLEDMADDLVGLMDALALERADLVGVSMGAMISQLAALRAPDRVRSLTSIMSTTGDRRLPWPKLKALWWLVRAAPQDLEARAEHYFKLFGAIGSKTFPRDREESLVRIRANIERGGYNEAGKARQFAAVLMQRNRTRALQGLTVPTLVIHGLEDPLVQPACGEATAAAARNSELMLVEGMGHDLPEALHDRLVAAIDAHARKAGAAVDRGAA